MVLLNNANNYGDFVTFHRKSGILRAIKIIPFVTFLILFAAVQMFAQSVGDYRSNANTNWSTLSTWQRYSGSGWSTPTGTQGYPGQFGSSSSATINIRHNVTLNVSPANSVGNVYITDQSTLTTIGNPNLTITGNLQLISDWFWFFIDIPLPSNLVFGNGNLSVGTLIIDASGTLNFGTGTFTSPGTVTIDTDAWGLFDATFTNNGTAILSNTGAGVLNGGGLWNQEANSILNYAGSTLTVGTLSASNPDNVVNYYRGGNQTIHAPTINTYHHLTLSGSGSKTSSSNLTIAGNLTISGTTQLDVDSGNDNINLAGNWAVTSTNADPFREGTQTVTLDGNSTQAISTVLANGETFYSLAIDNASNTIPQIILNDKVNVSTTLTLTDGIVQSDVTNVLIMLNNSSANIGSANSYVDGPIQFNMAASGVTRTLNFPIGKNGLYGAVELSVRHTSATSYSYTAEAIASSAAALNYTLATGTDRVSGLRYWDIKRGLTASPTVSSNAQLNTTGGNRPRIRIYYVAEDEVTQPSTLTVVKNTNGNTVWSNIGASASGSPTGSVITTSGSANFTSFSYFTLANLNGGTNPLPIELLSFSAQLKNNEVELKWSTASETNNDYFTIERATDLERFEAVIKEDGKGTTKELTRYKAIDRTPLYGRSYYRLKQTDFDGKYSYSSLQVIDYEGPVYATLSASPNPLTGTPLTIKIEGLKETTHVPVRILNVHGQLVYDKIFEVKTPGTLTEQIPSHHFLTSGLYIIKAGETLYLTQKLVVE